MSQAPGSPSVDTGTDIRFSEITEQLTQMQELVAHLKDLIREKDAALGNKDEQVKVTLISKEYFQWFSGVMPIFFFFLLKNAI